MLEYFTYKKVKKHQAERKGKEAVVKTPPPLLDEDDERFLERIVSPENTPPPLPTRPTDLSEAGDTMGNASQMVRHEKTRPSSERRRSASYFHRKSHDKEDKGKGKENVTAEEPKKLGRFASILRRSGKDKTPLHPNSSVVTPNEAHKEEDDLTHILDDLSLSAHENRAFSLNKESTELVQKFTLVLKDLINGVPTAYDDLVHLLDDSHQTLNKTFEKMPGWLQKLVTQLPDKLTKNIAPELLAVAAEAPGLGAEGVAAGGAGLAGAAKSFFTPSTLKNLVTKPGAVASTLKAIMNALKLRWPAFMGTNVLLSLGLFVLLFFFWYCHKRGREVRLERENGTRTPDTPGTPTRTSRRSSHERPHSRTLRVEGESSRSHAHSSREGSSRSHRSSDDRDEDEAALARRRERRRLHEEEKARRREEDERSDERSKGSRPSSSKRRSDDGRKSRSGRD
ncbi:hypothetical protein BGZ60DRAFT_377549 [Tricladium varicosporioides]|nr:hypothetical protein BGZ60DRAFT_377549 [Hymenoscyphus varicosporioides]